MPFAISLLIHATWGLLQTAGGAAQFLFALRRPHRLYRGAVVTRWRRRTGASFGLFIFLPPGAGDAVLVHEYGHTVQSLMLGPLFPLVIALPSSVWCHFPPLKRLRARRGISYYSLYCEAWANRLGERVTGRPAPESRRFAPSAPTLETASPPRPDGADDLQKEKGAYYDDI